MKLGLNDTGLCRLCCHLINNRLRCRSLGWALKLKLKVYHQGIKSVSIVVQFKCLLPVINGFTYLRGVFNDVEVVFSYRSGHEVLVLINKLLKRKIYFIIIFTL